jgi:hypothetical protein
VELSAVARFTIHLYVEENDRALPLESSQAPSPGRVPFGFSRAPGAGRL